MSQPVENNGFEPDIADFEETTPASPVIPPPQSPGQGSTMPPSDPITPVTHITPAPVAASASPTPVLVEADEGSPVLKHIATIASQAEETVRTMTQDMDMSSIAFVARVSLGNSPQSLLDLHLLNTQFQHVFNFATSTTVLGYLDGITPDELEGACNDVCLFIDLIFVLRSHVFQIVRMTTRSFVGRHPLS